MTGASTGNAAGGISGFAPRAHLLVKRKVDPYYVLNLADESGISIHYWHVMDAGRDSVDLLARRRVDVRQLLTRQFALKDAVEAFTLAYPQARFVVTSRVVGYGAFGFLPPEVAL